MGVFDMGEGLGPKELCLYGHVDVIIERGVWVHKALALFEMRDAQSKLIIIRSNISKQLLVVSKDA